MWGLKGYSRTAGRDRMLKIWDRITQQGKEKIVPTRE
jgi:hypothetical protein